MFVEETVSNKAQGIWQVIRVARNLFGRRSTMPAALDRIRQQSPNVKGLVRYVHWFYQPREAVLIWDGESRTMTTIKSGVP